MRENDLFILKYQKSGFWIGRNRQNTLEIYSGQSENRAEVIWRTQQVSQITVWILARRSAASAAYWCPWFPSGSCVLQTSIIDFSGYGQVSFDVGGQSGYLCSAFAY
jgi:hypothetical protein